ncbi:MFS transporter, partial [Salmonella enterica subsp. enterica serovar Anatum]|nr:MFS transporter [Salmonella enterica subsp. enterica serovar Anatum]
FHLPSRLRPMLLASAVATGILILSMAIFTQPAVVMLVRFLAGALDQQVRGQAWQDTPMFCRPQPAEAAGNDRQADQRPKVRR